MRRTYITPEFSKTPVFGTLNMAEESNFFGAKMLEVQDAIGVTNENLVWYQRPNGEQVDLDTENTLDPNTFSSSQAKLATHTLKVDEAQSQFSRDNSTRWLIDIDTRALLTSYVFAQMKSNRTFEGVRTQMTVFNNIDVALTRYIELNVLNRYRMSRIELFVRYVDLREQNALRFRNKWSDAVATPDYALNKFETVSDYEQKALRVIFTQEKPSTLYNFEYFFNVHYEKI